MTVLERSFVVQQIQRQKYLCTCRVGVVTAPAPVQLIPGGRYSIEFAAHVAVEKYLLCGAPHKRYSRRKFIEAEPPYPQCAEAIELIGQLFAIDRDTDDPTLLEGDAKLAAIDSRQEARSQRAPPILAKLREWSLEQRGLPKSGLRKAIDYTLGQWQGLTTFLTDPFVPLHNNDTYAAR